MSQDHFSKFATGLDSILDHELIVAAEQALKDGTPVTIDASINNLNRCVGTMLSNEISKRYGAAGLPDGTITVNLKGQTGQSFGFTLAKGVTLNVSGDANDGCGKGLSGGEIYVTPQPSTIAAGLVPEDNVVVGNVALYGATSGRAFFRGKAGERFCVRNSGAITVVEGMGDHGCEYMTGGRVVCLGETGINFGAGMSGGIAYMYDPNSTFAGKCNMEMVGLEEVGDAEEIATLKGYLESHVQHTGSTVAANLLAQWPAPLKSFIKVMPHDYKRVLLERAAAADAAAAEPIAASAA
eukprot:4583889-Pleurochrysis_carterae.AAC.1